MLEPGSRSHLMELLRPPAGCKFDAAIGTTYSLDLMSALMLPLSFVLFDWERDNGEISDPLALLEALELNRDRFSIFCQVGNIRLPDKYSRLLTLLEPCIHEVRPPDTRGVFHPKVWAVRYVGEDATIRYRVLCLSRNLTFDRSWDTVVALDGVLTNRTTAFPANRSLAELIGALPGLCLHSPAKARAQMAAKISDELLRVKFDTPDGFDGYHFWNAGLDGKRVYPFGRNAQACLIVSPFLSEGVIRDFVDHHRRVHLVSREESLQAIQAMRIETLQACESVHSLNSQLSEEETGEVKTPEANEVLEGLHAKLYVLDHGTESHVFSGSFNATHHAFAHNVEFMVEMVGKRKNVGVARFLAEEKGSTRFADLLQPYSLDAAVVAVDPLTQEFDDLIRLAKNAVIDAFPHFRISRSKSPELYELRLWWEKPPAWMNAEVRINAWPITLPKERALPVTGNAELWEVSIEGITPLLAISIVCEIGQVRRESSFVMNLPLAGAPEDRHDRVVASLLEGKEQLLRYILFLLAAGDEEAVASGELGRMLIGGNGHADLLQPMPSLLETMLRALYKGPEQLKRVSAVLEKLKRSGKADELIGEEFESVWRPIWEVARNIKSRK